MVDDGSTDDRRHRRAAGPGSRARAPASQRGQGRRAQPRPARRAPRDRRHGRCRHRLRARHGRPARRAASPTRAVGAGPATPRSATGADCSAAGSTSSTSSASTSTGGCTTCCAACRPSPAPSAHSAATRCATSAASATPPSPRTPTSRSRSCRAGWRVVYEETRAPGPRHPPHSATCGGNATAGATAPCRRCGSTAARSSHHGAAGARTARTALPAVLPDRSAAARARHRPLRALRAALPRPAPRRSPTGSASSPSNSLLGLYAFRLDGERLRRCGRMPLQQFVYRQLMYLVVIQSLVSAITGARLRWHRMERYGSLRVPPAQSQA